MTVDRGWIAQRVGLAHGEVRLATNHDAWLQVAKHLCDCIKSAADDSVIAVEHIGSTAVDEMVAKPIVDIAVGLRDANDIEAMRGVVERLGFAYRDDVGNRGGQVFILDDAGRRLVNLHLVMHDDSQWRDWIALRDLLRDDRTARVRYAAVKERAARVHQHDRDAYTASKTAVIRDLLAQPIE